MNQLNAVITHLPAAEAEQDLRALRELAPDSRFVACYTGPRAEFENLEDAIFLDDGGLAGAPRSYQSYHGVFAALAEHSFDALYLIEYDHLVLDPGFEGALIDLAERTGADFMGKNCVPRNHTNWPHYARFRRNPDLLEHLRRISTRDDPTVLFGTLGSRDVAVSATRSTRTSRSRPTHAATASSTCRPCSITSVTAWSTSTQSATSTGTCAGSPNTTWRKSWL